MRHKALVLKVSDYSLTRVFPFEKSYFFHKTARNQISKIFRFGLITPITSSLQGMIKSVTSGSLQDNPSVIGEVFPMQRFDVEMEKELVNLKPLREVTGNPKDYFMVIPILMKQTHVNLQRTFAYLFPMRIPQYRMASLKRTLTGNKGSSADAYVNIFKSITTIFENKEIKSPCMFCKRAIFGMAGHCLYGSGQCRREISFAGEGQFVENLKKYRDTMINFPDRLKGADHGSISNNNG